MWPIPQIKIHQQYALLDYKAEPATLRIEQPPATMVMHTTQAKVHIQQPQGELHVDNTKAFEAAGTGGILAMDKRIADQMFNLAVQSIAKIVETGNRMAAIQNPGDSIPQIAFDNAFEPLLHINYLGEPSYLNVAMEYTPHQPVIEPELGEVQVQVVAHRPIIESERGKLNVYLAQRNFVEITPPNFDERR